MLFFSDSYTEGLTKVGDIPGGSMNPSSEFIYDSIAERYYGELLDISAYEIKEINPELAVQAVDKYGVSSDWRFDDPEVEDWVFKLIEHDYYDCLQELRFPMLDKDEFIEAVKRQGDGSLSHTSCGFPLSREFRDKVEAIDSIGSELYDYILNGDILDIPSVFTLFLKDEVRAKNKEVRSILSSPLHHLAACVFLFHGFHKKNHERCA